ncbi:helix-turn-helix domain-containing protein [Gluconacetobacter sp. 1b LMG 1731]|uniref:Helix-turn-helix domain-containing protein n=1 Tax=Gluconacetobacter dulcium TaxID=2729096 RepID=A0A7W4NVP6_9PROT|nr:helix-turn-helix domain-containing protein [Gluconacetobacter dulcium]MBB2164670.1 helix-turn-helix domain-containing protein [Gluconacetobacter dulcium]MBB2193806.1 helix-turn-helix domain-containing protein [Gluconacetobacter dulcium]
MLAPTPPTPGEIRASRLAADLTQKQAGALVAVTLSTWQKWEYGRHPMPRALYDLFIIKTKKRTT